ncbi:hypothetical protein [Klebsiella phage vB_KpnS-VAC35]|uniref:Uncharacterized protein n=1 Tax=Klebsiella phage vB_KpnS-VAC35 TaxID=2866696 RepID=A0AAE9C5R7_9CAUD|nr:hypothetical protein [Klebsiella phage vB_KpnS-VAC35]
MLTLHRNLSRCSYPKLAGEVRFELTVIRLTGDRLYHLLLLSQIDLTTKALSSI